jgi:hypothetical protein
MNDQTAHTIKTSTLQGVYGKYESKKNCVLADLMTLLENPNGADYSKRVEAKIQELAETEMMLTQITTMFGPEQSKTGCCVENTESIPDFQESA